MRLMIHPLSGWPTQLAMTSATRLVQVGATIREKLIPHAVHWYTGEAIEDDPFGDMGAYDE